MSPRLPAGAGSWPASETRLARVPVFTREVLHFVGGPPVVSRREVDREIVLPALSMDVAAVTLELQLACPRGGCDYWDRKGYLGLVHARDQAAPEVIELVRFVTPYGVGGRWTLDVTNLLPLLHGQRTFRLFIDTWVGPGHAQGAGWLVDATLHYRYGRRPGAPALPMAIYPVWSLREVMYGDPASTVANQLSTRRVSMPPGAGRVEFRALVTGHGQGNADNCAEFCPREHTVRVGGIPFRQTIWRDDCGANRLDGQKGNWRVARAGWCPGSVVRPWVADVSAAAGADIDLSVDYDVEPYVNSCRPDAAVCDGCTLESGCSYDGGRHTPPSYLLSGLLIVYPSTARDP